MASMHQLVIKLKRHFVKQLLEERLSKIDVSNLPYFYM